MFAGLGKRWPVPVRVDDLAPRELVLSPPVALQLQGLRGTHPRFDQVYDGIVWLILRKPEIGDANSITQTVNGEQVTTSFWIVCSQPKDPNLPHVLVTYRFDEESVEIIAIRSGRLNAF